MAKRQSKPFKVTAKLREALSGFAAAHEQSSKPIAAAMAALAGNFASIQARLGQVRVTDLNELLAAQRVQDVRLEHELAAKADLLLREITPPPRRAKTPRRTAVTPIVQVRAVMREIWPGRRPKLTDAKLLQRLGNALEQRGIHASPSTQRRALHPRRTK